MQRYQILADPLALFTDVGVCTECGTESTLTTDGIRAVAVTGREHGEVDAFAITRRGTVLVVHCGAPHRSLPERTCASPVEFDIATPGWRAWSDTPEHVRGHLREHGITPEED